MHRPQFGAHLVRDASGRFADQGAQFFDAGDLDTWVHPTIVVADGKMKAKGAHFWSVHRWTSGESTM